MIKFYTTIQMPDGTIHDADGAYALSLEGARADVIQNIREMIRENVRRGTIDLRGEAEIIDTERRILAIVPFAEAVEVIV